MTITERDFYLKHMCILTIFSMNEVFNKNFGHLFKQLCLRC